MTAGAGHRRAAEAIAEAARRLIPDVEVHCVDLLDYAPATARRSYPASYRALVSKLLWLWALGYGLLDQPWFVPIYQPLRRAWNRLIARRFVNWVEQLKPDWMIATHFFPGDVLADAGGGQWMRSRGVVVVTDLFPHRLWLTSPARAFVVGSEKTKELCAARGIDPKRIAALGIPVAQAFGAPHDRTALRSQLSLDPQRLTVLISSGGMGNGPIVEVVEQLLDVDHANPGRLQLLVVCGENAEMHTLLQSHARQAATPMRVFGFVGNPAGSASHGEAEPRSSDSLGGGVPPRATGTDRAAAVHAGLHMSDLMAASDMMITKAGGLTVTEALASGLPMIFCGNIPGQEQFNAEYVVEQEAGVMGKTPQDAVRAVVQLIEEPKRLEQLRQRARTLAKPRAAEELVQRLMENRL